jgi:pseudouridine-5'-phosphate glycosidase
LDTFHLLRVKPEVAEALAKRQAIVALESTLITHGLPYPDNLAAATSASPWQRSLMARRPWQARW